MKRFFLSKGATAQEGVSDCFELKYREIGDFEAGPSSSLMATFSQMEKAKNLQTSFPQILPPCTGLFPCGEPFEFYVLLDRTSLKF